MTPDQTFEVTKSLGIAAPLVVVLLYLLRLLIELLTRATDERKTITAQFVDAMKTTASPCAYPGRFSGDTHPTSPMNPALWRFQTQRSGAARDA